MTGNTLTTKIPHAGKEPEMRSVAAMLLNRASLGADRIDIDPIPGGRNNRVFRIRSSQGCYLLKQYFRHSDDPRDRLRAEWQFQRLLWESGVRQVPQPLAMDGASGTALFEWIDGRLLRRDAVSVSHMDEAGRFAVAIQALRGQREADAIRPASEACFSIDEHVALVQRRIERMAHIEAISDLHQQVQRWVNDVLLPRWEKWLAWLADELHTRRVDPTDELVREHRCLSPSDFGFHNALLREDLPIGEQLVFVDFEYAGWDDPAKLVCDFFCQPHIPVSIEWFDRFANQVLRGARPNATEQELESEVQRTRLLLPVYQFKWSCILLNEFLAAGRSRREHANAQLVSHEHLQAQFEKSQQIVARIANCQL